MITGRAFSLLRRSGLSPGVIDAQFNNPQTLVITQMGRTDSALPRALPVESFASYASIQKAFADKAVPPEAKYILYDNEHWSFTPLDEQSHPTQFADMARDLVHKNGRQLIFAPAANLAPVVARASGATAIEGTRFSTYLRVHMAADGAGASDIFVIQAQQTEATPEAQTFAIDAVHDARSANPQALLLVGLSSNPDGRTVTVQDLLVIFRATQAEGTGYWLNIPESGAQCPSCGEPKVKEVADLVQLVTSTGG